MCRCRRDLWRYTLQKSKRVSHRTNFTIPCSKFVNCLGWWFRINNVGPPRSPPTRKVKSYINPNKNMLPATVALQYRNEQTTGQRHTPKRANYSWFLPLILVRTIGLTGKEAQDLHRHPVCVLGTPRKKAGEGLGLMGIVWWRFIKNGFIKP